MGHYASEDQTDGHTGNAGNLIFADYTNLVASYNSLVTRDGFLSQCGITEQEVNDYFMEDISLMAADYGVTPQEMFLKVKERYDGYHFAAVSEDLR